MRYKIIIKILIFIVLTVFSFWIIYPTCKSLVVNGGLGSDNSVTFSVNSQSIQSILQPVGFPIISEFKSYNIDIINLNNQYDISYIFSFYKNDPILQYINNIASSSELGVAGEMSFEIKSGKHYEIKNIPTNIAMIDKFGSMSLCGFNSIPSNCPEDPHEFSEISQKNIKIFACPNVDFRPLVIEIVLICVFWIVAINNFYDFLKNY